MTSISLNRISNRAREYFGGDVQEFWIVRSSSSGCYKLMQRPHYYPVRVAASSCALTAREAIREFNAMARFADQRHA